MEYDPTQYVGVAPYYLRGRPGYSADLPSVLADELGLDGTGHLVDVGSGPGTVGVQLASLFDRVTLVEPDPGMLAAARSHAAAAGLSSISSVRPRMTYLGSACARFEWSASGSRSTARIGSSWPSMFTGYSSRVDRSF